MSKAKQPHPMFVKAAKALCRINAEACGTNFDDEWKFYGDHYLQDAGDVLDAVAAPELLEALQECMADADAYEARSGKKLVGDWPAKARAAIAKATGEQP